MGTQFEILPLEVVQYLPFPNKMGRGRALAENGVAYVVKSDNGDRRICATEWICTAIADFLGLPVPQTKILKMKGQLVFGSELMSNRLADSEVAALLLQGKRPNSLVIPNLQQLLSRIYALDLALGNHDRHAENFLLTTEWSDDRTVQHANLRPFDFESSDLLAPRRNRLPMNDRSHTVTTGRLIRKRHGFDTADTVSMLTRFAIGRDFMISSATDGLPTAWLPSNERVALIERVKSDSFRQELLGLQQGLDDGRYL